MTAKSLRIAVFAGVAPRKLGSLEDTLVAIAQEARRRGHECTVFSLSPVHITFAERLGEMGGHWCPLEEIQGAPVQGMLKIRDRFDVCLITLVPFRSVLLAQTALAWPLRVVVYDGTSPPAVTRPRNRLSTLLDPLILARVAVVAAVSDFIRGRLESVFRLPRARTRTIYNGVDIARFRSPPSASSRAHDAPRILAVANLTHEKGIDLLITAMTMLRNGSAKLTIVGDGVLRGELETQVRMLQLTERVEFLGLRDDVHCLLGECDVFVHPARWQEAFGYTIAEAMAAGRPVVASRLGAIPELVQHEETGLLVPADDPSAFAEAIDTLLADPLRAREMGEKGYIRASSMFSLSASAANLVDLLEEVCSTERRTVATNPPALASVRQEPISFRSELSPRPIEASEKVGFVSQVASIARQEGITVVVPIHNAEQFLDETLRSIVDQEYSPAQIVVVDDGSHDASAAIVRRWIAKDPIIELVSVGTARGPSSARNI